MYYKPEWEQVIEGYVYRMKTPGGWLVGEQYAGPDGEGCTLCYVPDAGHDWVFEPEEKEEEIGSYIRSMEKGKRR